MFIKSTIVLGILAITLAGCTASSSEFTPFKPSGTFIRWEGANEGTGKMFIKDTNGTSFCANVWVGAEVAIDGETSGFDELKEGMPIQLITRNMTIVRVVAQSAEAAKLSTLPINGSRLKLALDSHFCEHWLEPSG